MSAPAREQDTRHVRDWSATPERSNLLAIRAIAAQVATAPAGVRHRI